MIEIGESFANAPIGRARNEMVGDLPSKGDVEARILYGLGKQIDKRSPDPTTRGNQNFLRKKNQVETKKKPGGAIDANADGIGKVGPFVESPLGRCGIQQNRRAGM